MEGRIIWSICAGLGWWIWVGSGWMIGRICKLVWQVRHKLTNPKSGWLRSEKKRFLISFSSASNYYLACGYQAIFSFMLLQGLLPMVSVFSYPAGVSGKSLSSLGTSSTQSPIDNTPSVMTSSNLTLNSNEVFRDLVESTKARNCMVRKLNE